MDTIAVNQSTVIMIPIPESQSTDTVTYEIIDSSGSVLASGSMAFVRDEIWKATYTPTALGTIVLKVNDTTISSKRETIMQVVGTITDSTPAGDDFSYDTSTNLGKVRALINDIVAASYVMSDTQINAFLSLHSNDLYLTAAQCMMAIASSKALIAKMKKAGNYSEDFTVIAKECREAAKMFREMAMQDPAEAVGEAFYTDFSYNDLLAKKHLRSESD